MKEVFKKGSIFLIFIFVLFLSPSVVKAEKYSSDFIKIDNLSYDYDGEDLSLQDIYFLRFSSHQDSDNPLGAIYGKITNKSGYYLSAYLTIDFYKANYQIIARSTGTSYPSTSYAEKDSKPQIGNNLLYIPFKEYDFLGSYTIDEIEYFKVNYYTIKGSPLPGSNPDNSNNTTSSSNLNTTTKTPSENSTYSYYDYVIDKYDININVKENNTFNIIETITAYFNVPKHGIFRTIPLKNSITRLDGTTSKNRVQISNLSVDDKYTTSKENGNYKIKIGSASKTLTGEKTYVIKYTYNLGKDPSKDYDELYYNLIGTDWDTVIGNITFTITLPKEFDSSKLGFSSGYIGSTNNSNVKYNINGNTITGSYDGILSSHEALTIRCELPEGYFINAGLTINFNDYIFFLIPVLFLVISIFLWYKFGRDDEVIETVEFYPPENLNSLDVGFLYNGKAENKDVTSLLIYLANKGYIQIIDPKIDLNKDKVELSESATNKANQKIIELQNRIKEEEIANPNSNKLKYYKNMLEIYQKIDTPIDYNQYGLASTIKKNNKKSKFIFKKIKDYDGYNPYEDWFMEGLFEYGRTEVNDKMLYNNFYVTNNRILHNVNNKQNRDRIYEKSSSNKKIFIILMIIITYFLITIPPISAYGDLANLPFALLFPAIGFSVIISMGLSKNPIFVKLFCLIWGLFFGGVPWLIIVLPSLLQDYTYLIGYIIGLISVFGMIMCLKYLPKRTPYGNEMLGKIKGFKNFLETAEKDKLETLVMQNPTYFYDILPFTYVLNVSDKWIKKFESISLQEPNWYNSSSSFDVISFGTFINTTMLSAGSAMTSSPSSDSGGSSSGGSSSGGGSSGGGSGGGGGGSW